jgi:uncharacterized protein (UPF0332 family)
MLPRRAVCLVQADGMSAEAAPESVIHLAYYAVFHAATAVLLRHRGRAGLTHTGLIGAFGRLDVGLGEHARTLAVF